MSKDRVVFRHNPLLIAFTIRKDRSELLLKESGADLRYLAGFLRSSIFTNLLHNLHKDHASAAGRLSV
jgi:hypothetical protein